MNRRKFVGILIILYFMHLPLLAFAQGISMDGNFEDWSDKPYLSDSSGDGSPTEDIKLIQWYPDSAGSALYFYCERAEGDNGDNNKFEDWNFEINFTSDGEAKKAYIQYHPPSNKVEVTVHDGSGRFLWGAKGKWGDDKDEGKRVEFYIPMSYLASSIESGYQINAYFVSGSDRLPDTGNLTISTVSTFPVQTALGLILTTAFLGLIFRKGMQKRKKGVR